MIGMEAVGELGAAALGAAGGAAWTWWLLRGLRVADEDRTAPLRDAAITGAEASRALADIIAGLGRELAEAHAANGRMLAELTLDARGRRFDGQEGPNGDTAEGAVRAMEAEARRTRERMAARAAVTRPLVDPTGEGLGLEDGVDEEVS